MKPGVVTIDQEYARECCRLARLTEDQRIQRRLLEMAREWMTAAMQGIAWPGARERKSDQHGEDEPKEIGASDMPI